MWGAIIPAVPDPIKINASVRNITRRRDRQAPPSCLPHLLKEKLLEEIGALPGRSFPWLLSWQTDSLDVERASFLAFC